MWFGSFSPISVNRLVLKSRVGGKNVRSLVKNLSIFLIYPLKDLTLPKLSWKLSLPLSQSIEHASTLIHGDNNLGLKANEYVVRFTHLCQVLPKIIMHNIVPKAGEFGRAKGCIPILMYCNLTSQGVNLPLMLFNNMTVDNNAHHSLPLGMVLSRLFSHWQVDVQGELFQPSPELLG